MKWGRMEEWLAERSGRKKCMTGRNGRGSWEQHGITAFCSCKWIDWLIKWHQAMFTRTVILKFSRKALNLEWIHPPLSDAIKYDPQRWEVTNYESGFVIGCTSLVACEDKNWARKMNSMLQISTSATWFTFLSLALASGFVSLHWQDEAAFSVPLLHLHMQLTPRRLPVESLLHVVTTEILQDFTKKSAEYRIAITLMNGLIFNVNTTHMYGFSFNVSTIDFNPLR